MYAREHKQDAKGVLNKTRMKIGDRSQTGLPPGSYAQTHLLKEGCVMS